MSDRNVILLMAGALMILGCAMWVAGVYWRL